ncbi:AAA family ATPase [Ruminococcaceae bacterium OttesenSCG-928-N02]|nr:AAA family ATPase [Ruminococcaceae bacterium OttesenSCG-928-N02]
MASIIKKIKFINYKRFCNYTIEPNSRINILAGDNEVGKSSVLEAIDLVSSGNIRKVEAIGIDRLLNIEAVQAFNSGIRIYDNLPLIIVELYLNGDFDHTMNGKNNTDRLVCDGIRLVCAPNADYQTEIAESLREQEDYFPYDYYSIRFSTFADEGDTGYKKKLRSILIDSTNMGSDYATNDFVKRMYIQYTESDTKERAVHKSKYRQLKNSFRADSLQSLNDRIPTDKNYAFGLKSSSSLGLETDLMIYESEISIDNKGTGKQVFIKTDFALERAGDFVDVVLIEEPENHLSHVNLRKLIERIADAQSGQLFITTHNSLISTRLELQNLLIMHERSANKPISLHDLSADTAKYFMKAPVANIIEFTLSNKAILVEGPSEYMLFEKFYTSVTNHKPEMDGVNIIDVRGLSFKRYLEISKLLGSKVAVVTDNDGNKQQCCIDKYSDYATEDNIGIFFEADEEKHTFEKVLYADNTTLCNQLFGTNAVEYMLKNKTEAAYQLLAQNDNIAVPEYIRGAITWIKE